MAEEIKKDDGGKKEELVQIPKSQLDSILNRLDILTSAADKSRLEWAMGQDPTKKKPLVRRVNLNVYEDPETSQRHVILGWKMVVDEVFVSTQGVPYEKQVIALYLDGGKGEVSGKPVNVNYVDFVRRTKKEAADILSITEKTEGDVRVKMLNVKIASTGRILDVNSTFVN